MAGGAGVCGKLVRPVSGFSFCACIRSPHRRALEVFLACFPCLPGHPGNRHAALAVTAPLQAIGLLTQLHLLLFLSFFLCQVIKDKATGVSAGFGFAKFTDTPSAQAALDKVAKTVLFGQVRTHVQVFVTCALACVGWAGAEAVHCLRG